MLHKRTVAIGEVSRITGVSPSTLRFWESVGLFETHRTDGGQRRFDDGQIDLIRRIEHLRDVYGYNLRAIRSVLADEGLCVPAVKAGPEATDLGTRLRALRQERRLGVREVARRAGVAPSFVSMIERNRASPSAATLNAIALALGTGLAELFGATGDSASPVVRLGCGRMVQHLGPSVRIEQISVGRGLIDCEIWTLKPGARSEGAYAHSGEELIQVIEGRFEIALDGGAAEILDPGDTIVFASERQHRWRNPGPAVARVLWINAEPSRFRPTAPKRVAFELPPDVVLAARGEDTQQLGLTFPDGTRVYRYLDTHTAGHPTRIFLDHVDGLRGDSVAALRDSFRERCDHLRPLLLHEPRGHAATFGVFLVPSSRADHGAIFVSSYSYLDMCGHGTIGLARALHAWGLLQGRDGFTLETPAGVVEVGVDTSGASTVATVLNVPSWAARQDEVVTLDDGRKVAVDIAFGGCWYAIVAASDLGERLNPDRVVPLMALGAAIKDAVARRLAEAPVAGRTTVDSVLFHQPAADGATRQFVVLAGNKFDRSPCGTGLSARMAQLHARGMLGRGDGYVAENILGVRFAGEVVAVLDGPYGRPAIRPAVTGSAHVSGMGSLILEPSDPLPEGFLCR